LLIPFLPLWKLRQGGIHGATSRHRGSSPDREHGTSTLPYGFLEPRTNPADFVRYHMEGPTFGTRDCPSGVT
jgi:hypothetical protein